MTIAYRSGVIAKANATSVTATIPSGVATGDVMVMAMSWNNSTAAFSSLGGTVTGWTQVSTEQTDSSMSLRVYQKVAGSGDHSGTVVLNLTGSVKCNLIVEAYSGVDNTTPVNTALFAPETGTSASHVGPTITTTANGCMIVTFVADKAGALTTWTQPTGYTLRHSIFDVATAESAGAADFLQTTAGAITPDHWVADTATDKAIVAAVALNVAASSSPPTAAVAGKEYADATGSVAGGAGSLSYAWTQTSGPTVTLSSTTTSTVTFARPIPMTSAVVLRVTVTESGSGLTDHADVTFAADGGAAQAHFVYDGSAWV